MRENRMTREEVRGILGGPDYIEEDHNRWGIQFPAKDCFRNSCLQVRYINNKVDDIQSSSHADYVCTLAGLCVHDSTVEEIARVAEEISPLDKAATEFPYTFSYPGTGLAFWREVAERPLCDTGYIT